MQNDKRLPCPFCAGEARVVYAIHDYNMWGVYCDDCGANVETNEVAEADTAENAVRLWNTRKSMERIVEQLEGKIKELTDISSQCKLSKVQKAQNYGYMVAINHAIEIVRNGGKE